jgi:hypothetical protein
MKTKDTRYAYPLKLDRELKKPLKEAAKNQRRNLNDVIVIAVERYLAHLKSQES